MKKLVDLWRPIQTWGADWLEAEPPAREYLLTTENNGKEVGIIPLGKAGMLAAAGAGGKSWLVTQLALAVATGVDWVGFRVANPGKVLLALGEEEPEEARRRLYYAAKAMGLDDAARRTAARRIVLLPLAGTNSALTGAEPSPREAPVVDASGKTKGDAADGLPVTALFWEMLELLERGADEDGWRLLVLDPMSRFAGLEVEKDNAVATRFVQAMERFTSVMGHPTVLVTHHTSKLTRREGQSATTDAAAATAARGASALTDGFRFQCNLEPFKRVEGAAEIAVLKVVKNNYGAYLSSDTHLVRDQDCFGAMRCATQDEIVGHGDKLADIAGARIESVRQREHNKVVAEVEACLGKADGAISVAKIKVRVKRGYTKVEEALETLREAGKAEQAFAGVKAVGWQLVALRPASSRFVSPDSEAN